MKRTVHGLAALALIFVSLAVRPSSVGADDELDVRVVSVDDGQFPSVTLVLAIEAVGRPVPSLEPADVTITDNNAPATVTSVRRIQDASIPTTVVVALDTSGSMAGANLLRAKEALSELVSGFSATDRVGLVSFSDRPVVVAAPGSTTAVAQAVSGLQAAGNTALYGAVAESARVATVAGDARRLVILLTDGEEYGNVSGLSREASLEQAAASGAIFYVIGLGVGADREYLSELAARTGGRFLDAPTTADLDRGYAAIEETLRGQFVVTAQSSAPPAPLSRSMTVDISRGAETGTAVVEFESARQLSEPVVQPTSAPELVPVPTTTTEAPEEEGGSSLWIAGPVVLLGAVAVLALLWRRRRREPPVSMEPVSSEAPLIRPTPVEHEQSTIVARLLPSSSSDGPVSDEFQIGHSPAAVGWSADCHVRLPRAEGLSAVHARLWWRDGSLMLHDLSGGGTRVNGAQARWASLTDLDRLEFGPFSFQVSVADRVTSESPG